MSTSIFGADDRQLLGTAELSGFQARVTVRISASWADGYLAFGSGVLVGGNDVLTAGHVVYSARHGGLAANISVAPIYQNGVSSVGEFMAVGVVPFSPNWGNLGLAADLAVIQTSADIGHQLGWVGPSVGYAGGVLSGVLKSTGYAADVAGGQVMVRTAGTVDASADGVLMFRDDMDLGSGQSGSALLDLDASGLPVLRGVMLGYRYGTNGWENLARDVDASVQQWLLGATGGSTDWSVNPKALAFQVGRLYLGIFDRLPDEGGLNFWIDRAEAQFSLAEIAAQFVYSDEFLDRYGDFRVLGDQVFIELVYSTLLNRTPDASGMAFWLERMAQELSQEALIVEFSESAEAIANTTALLTGIHPLSPTDWAI